MSEIWGHYFADMGGSTASTVFDDGIADQIDTLPHPCSLKVRLALREPRADGLTTDAEAEQLGALENRLVSVLRSKDGLFLGRVTGNGVRWILGLVHSEGIEVLLAECIRAAGYPIEIFINPDPTKSVYWDDLYPDGESRTVMQDMQVLNALKAKGDERDIVRPVWHWTYFDKWENAEAFCLWLVSAGYQHGGIEKTASSPDEKWLVRSQHECSMHLDDVTHHTLAHYRRSKEHFGLYDGWETSVQTL